MKSEYHNFTKIGDHSVRLDDISFIDWSRIEELVAVVHLKSSEHTLTAFDIHALELAMKTCPSVLESKRLQWKRHVWSVHNLIGHPMMQICAFFRLYKLAFWFHDVSVPRAIGKKDATTV